VAIYKKKTVQISSFLDFFDSSDPVDIIDITSDATRQDSRISLFLESPGSYVYETKFCVDTKKAKSYGVSAINFDFYTEYPNRGSSQISGASFQVQLETQEQPLVNLGGAEDSFKYSPSLLSKVLVSNKTSKLNVQKIDPVFLPTIPNKNYSSPGSFSEESKSSLLVNKTDPAKVLSPGRSLLQTPSNVANFGITNDFVAEKSSNFSKIFSSSTANSSISLKKIKDGIEKKKAPQNNTLSDSLVFVPVTQQSSDPDTLPVFLMNVISNKREYTREFYIDKQSVQGLEKIYLKITAQISDNRVIEILPLIYTINHGTEIQDFLANPLPPSVRVLSDSISRVSFLLTKEDPTLQKIKVVRVIYNPNVLFSKTESRADIDFREENSVYFDDDVDNMDPNVVTYRFIAVNSDGSYGNFESIVLNSYKKAVDTRKALTATTPISIRASNKTNSIQILVDTLNDQVFTLRLLRQDLGMNDEIAKTVTTINNQQNEYFTIVGGQKGTYEFLDYDIVPGRHYRYFAAYRLGTGNSASICLETVSDEDEVIIRIPSFGKENITSDIKDPVISVERGLYSVSFNLQIQESQEIYNVLIDSLTRSGVSSQFLQDFQNDSQKLKEVSAFIVERVDRTNGKRVRMGVFPPGTFIDNPDLRNLKLLPEIESGKKYEYVCKLCVRPPETFLQSAKVGFVARASSDNVATKVSSLKFSGGLRSLYGRLPSEKVLREGTTVEQNFSEGQTGIELLAEVDIPAIGISVSKIEKKEKKNYNLLTWTTSGDASAISYFLVYVSYAGQEHLLGTVSAIGANASYKFRDTRFAGEVGEKKYSVRAVTTSDDISVQSAQVSTFTESSIPLQPFSGIATVESKNTKNSYLQVDFSVADYKLAAERSFAQKDENISSTDVGSFIVRGRDGVLIQKSVNSIFGENDLSSKMLNSLPFNQVDTSDETASTIESFKKNFLNTSIPSSKQGLIERYQNKILPPKGFSNS
jgi:hypothetical protein